MPVNKLEHLEASMAGLDQSLLAKDKEAASEKAQQLESFASLNCKKSFFDYAWELFVALAVALVIATLVRQVWFELYEIPTGSMRPTFREQDHLTVSKTAFGINFPLETKHLYFDPDLVQRSSVLIFSGDGMAMSDVDTTYFGIFPYKKRFIKRAIGKPGDSIYFYGGRLYGVDKDGNDLVELRDSPWMESLEYIPFLSYIGSPAYPNRSTSLLRHMNIPVGRLSDVGSGRMYAEVFDGKSWIKDDPEAQKTAHDTIKTYSDWFGMRNFAEARLLTKEELKQQLPEMTDIPEGVLYLQLHHTPSLSYPTPVDARSRYSIGYNTVIPLQQKHLDTLMDNLYTARFVVSDGKGRNYSLNDNSNRTDTVPLPGVPDGKYEFYFGKASKINWGGVETAVPADSPLYSHDPKNIQKLYNLGIMMMAQYIPNAQNKNNFPNRYAYFRDGDLYLMGVPVLKKDDPVLIAFNEEEKKKEAQATVKAPYVAFRDYGPPVKDGKIDVDFIRTFGVKVPEQKYMVLGDNHAMSSDSRVFGFVPQNNIQGAPVWIIWPPGDRIGAPAQKAYPCVTLPRAIVWSIAGLIGAIWYWLHRRNLKKPIFVKKVRR